MNIAVLSSISRNAGGLFYSVRGLCKSLEKYGCNPTIFSPMDEYAREDLHLWDPLPVELFPTFGPLNTSLRIRRRLNAFEVDLIHVHGIWLDSQWVALQCQKKNGVPVVISPRGMLDPWAVRNSAWKKKLVGKLFANESLRKATCIHALCQSEAESIRAYGLRNPIAIIPNGVELPSLAADHRPPTSGGKRRLLFLGRIHPKKGLEELLRAWSMERGEWQNDWQLLIAGWDDGGHQQNIEAQIKESGLEGSVSFIGPQFGAEKDRLLRDVDAFILPSYSEGLPVSVLEAWSYGLPVIMTEACNIPEGFAAEAALKVEPKADSIAAGLNQLADMTDVDLHAMGIRGRDLVERRFVWHKIAENTSSVYEQALNGQLKAGSIIQF